jgi:aryl-alcohol dehydrogenase-like predicted oxidoreductase
MDYVNLGRTGLKVSRLTLGCMTFGAPDRGFHGWTLPEEQSRPLIRKALEMGVTFLDTANIYSDGTSEEIVGRAVKDFARREELVIATKVHGRMRKDPNGAGLSRKAIMTEIDASLRRLGTDYVDLYQIHRWDPQTPIEETLEALHDVVKAGKARYIGASSMYAWQFAKAVYTSRRHGWTEFVSMQNYVNLLYREEEREMLPLCRELGVGVIPWSPLARGRLARTFDETSARQESDVFGQTLYEHTKDADRKVIEAVGRVAEARGVPRAQVALAWVLHKPGITAPIVGASKPEHLDDAAAALSLKLTPEEIAALEAAYVPHAVVGFG